MLQSSREQREVELHYQVPTQDLPAIRGDERIPSARDNELIRRVGPDTPMGDLLRQYWIPFLFSWEVEPGDSPERVRLLGEDLIAFRDSSGQIGLIQNNCPHRGASLFFGRNEELDPGIRCVYHGWKFDTQGNCVDMPNRLNRISRARSALPRTPVSSGSMWCGPIWGRRCHRLHCRAWWPCGCSPPCGWL
jgi:nitrite reductase/ring-hydroxylating ferredoxin subunit